MTKSITQIKEEFKLPLIIKIEQEIIKSQKELGSYYLSCATREQSRKIERIEALKRHLNVAKETFQEAKQREIKWLLENRFALSGNDNRERIIVKRLQELKGK